MSCRHAARVAASGAIMAVLAACGGTEPHFDLLAEFELAEQVRTPHEIDFGEPAARGYMGSGWSTQDEKWTGAWSFVWGTGASSSVRFEAVDTVPSVIRFRARPPRSEAGSQQRVTFVLNGTAVGAVDLGDGAEVYRLVLPPDVALIGENELELRYAFSVAASDDDSRERAVAWDWLRLVMRDEEGSPEEIPPARVDEGGLHVPPATRLDYFVDLAAGSALHLSAAGAGNHPEARLAIETLDAASQTAALEVTGAELGAGVELDLAAAGPTRLSLRVAHDPGQRGVRVRTARVAGSSATTARPAASTVAAPGGRPNVIVYLVDTLRADHLGTYGYALPTSPALDAMAAEGMVFDRMYAQSGWTRTSVASVMTGLNPLVHGVMGRDDALPAEAITLPVLLSDLGYATVAVVTNGNVSQAFGFDRGFATFRYLNEKPETVNPEVHYLSDAVNTEFLGWLDGRQTGEPFFAYLHTTDPHAPYAPREPFLTDFVGDMPRSNLAWPRFARAFVAGQDALDATQVRDELVALYDAEIAFNDASFGALLVALQERGLDHNTVVVFTSDHGEEFLDHADYGHGKTLYQELIGVPLVVRMPGGAGGGTRPMASAQHVDLLPTIVELAGGVVPSWAQGRSLVSALADASWESAVPSRAYLELDVASVASLVDGDWHLLRTPMDGTYARTRGLRMFDRGRDPQERTDLRSERLAIAGLLLRQWRQAEAGEQPLFEVGAAEIDAELAARLRDLGYIR